LYAGGGICFGLDSESEVVRRGLCAVTRDYMLQRTVFYSPLPDDVVQNRALAHWMHDDIRTISRSILGGARGEDFGEFYAMEVYHWWFKWHEVRDFLNKVPLLALALNPPVVMQPQHRRRHARPFLEETFYHFAYPRRVEYGMNFVDVYRAARAVIGARAFETMRRNPVGDAVMERICQHLDDLDDSNVTALAKMFRAHGVGVSRCNDAPKFALFARHAVCTSTSVDIQAIV
jgi:hypothetical protein